MAKKAKNVETKRPRGRPPGQTTPPNNMMTLRLRDNERRALERLAADWKCTLAEAARIGLLYSLDGVRASRNLKTTPAITCLIADRLFCTHRPLNNWLQSGANYDESEIASLIKCLQSDALRWFQLSISEVSIRAFLDAPKKHGPMGGIEVYELPRDMLRYAASQWWATTSNRLEDLSLLLPDTSAKDIVEFASGFEPIRDAPARAAVKAMARHRHNL